MSEAENRNWTELYKRLDKNEEAARERDERFWKQLQDTRTLADKTALGCVTTCQTISALRDRADECDKRDAEHARHHGEHDDPPHLLIANPIAYAYHHPVRGFWMLVAWVGVPAALALSLVLVAGPGGGLRVLLQTAGIRSIHVPSPEPTRVP